MAILFAPEFCANSEVVLLEGNLEADKLSGFSGDTALYPNVCQQYRKLWIWLGSKSIP